MKGQGGGGTAKGGGKNRSSGGTEKVVKTKSRATKAINENILTLRSALFNENGKDKNVLTGIAPPFLLYNRNGLNLEVSLKFRLSKEEFDWAFNLTKQHMEDIYDESGYGWDNNDKKRELSEDGARFLLVREKSEGETLGKLVGFVHFRFTVQGEVMEVMAGNTTIFVWDIQIEDELQRKGLGKHLITLLELVARKQNISMISIPVQEADDIGLSFVEKLKGYNIDESLALYGFDSDEEGFSVYCKHFQVIAPKPIVDLSAALAAASVSETDKSKESNESTKDTKENPETVEKTDNEETVEEGNEEGVNDENDEGEEEGEVDLGAIDTNDVIVQLTALYVKEHGSEPDDVTIQQWKDTIAQAQTQDE